MLQGIKLEYDSSDSYEALPEWIKNARDFSKPSISILIIGNKVDLDGERYIMSEIKSHNRIVS